MRALIQSAPVWPTLLSIKVAAPTRPGIRRGPAPMKSAAQRSQNVSDRIALRLMARIQAWYAAISVGHQLNRLDKKIDQFSAMDASALREAHDKLCAAIRVSGHSEGTLINSLAQAVIAAGHSVGLDPNQGQRTAALALLQGRFVEMPTGEGKTLAVALAAAVSALDGTPVHVITANDYLADRDITLLTPFYSALGLTAACVLPTMDDDARRSAYNCDIAYVTGKQVAFDWLRDSLGDGNCSSSLVKRLGALTQPGVQSQSAAPLLRGLCLAIVDEADSLLIDDARTPVVLAAERARTSDTDAELVVALGLAQLLKKGFDFRVRNAERDVELTVDGQHILELFVQNFPGTWRAARYRDEHVRQALIALHLLHRDRDYIVRDGKIALIDEQSGRTLSDRRLQYGLQQLLELKEQCEASAQSEVVAAIAFQHFFSRYLRMAGTSGTLSEVRDELVCMYRASLVRIKPERSSRWREWKPMIVNTRVEQLERLVDELNCCRERGRPVLIGTRSVEQSTGVASMLDAYSIPHRVLNAMQDRDEALTVAMAGVAGQITVATNMAGRGTDIPLGKGVAEAGGLHIVSLAFNDARRIDRQLAGRAGRQGQPGSFRRIVSLDENELVNAMPHWLHAIACQMTGNANSPASAGYKLKTAFINHIVMMMIARAQRRLERRHAIALRLSFESHERLAHHVAIGGQPNHLT